jgi:hypothetical protein
MRTKRLNLDQLEERCVPSAPPVSSGHVPGHYGPLAPQEAASVATLNMTPMANQGLVIGDKLTVKITSRDNTAFNQSFNYANGTPLKTVRDTVLQSLTVNNWKAKAGTDDGAIIVDGHIGAGGVVNSPAKVSAVAYLMVDGVDKPMKPEWQPNWVAQDGVQVGQASTGTPWKLDFAVADGQADVMGADATLVLAIDSYNVTVHLTAGMNHVAAGNAVQQALLQAGFTDASVDGTGTVTFLNRPDGVAAMSVSESWSPGTPVGIGLYLEIGIADRFV